MKRRKHLFLLATVFSAFFFIGTGTAGAILLEKDVPYSQVPARPLPVMVHIYDSPTAAAPFVSQRYGSKDLVLARYFTYSGEGAYRVRLNFTDTAALTPDMDLWWSVEMNGTLIGQREAVPEAAVALFASESLTAGDADTVDGQHAGDFAPSVHTHPDATGITSLSAGTGITLSPNPTTTTGTVSVDGTTVAMQNGANTFTTGTQSIQTGASTAVGLAVVGAPSQAANLQEWRTDGGSVLAAVGAGGAVTAPSFAGSGAGLTSLNASSLSTGTVPSGRLSGTTASASRGTPRQRHLQRLRQAPQRPPPRRIPTPSTASMPPRSSRRQRSSRPSAPAARPSAARVPTT